MSALKYEHYMMFGSDVKKSGRYIKTEVIVFQPVFVSFMMRNPQKPLQFVEVCELVVWFT